MPAVGCVTRTHTPTRRKSAISKLAPDAPVWAPVVCLARREPGAEQPDQYALSRGLLQIPADGLATVAAELPYSRVRKSALAAATTTYRTWKRLAGRPGGTRPLTPKPTFGR